MDVVDAPRPNRETKVVWWCVQGMENYPVRHMVIAEVCFIRVTSWALNVILTHQITCLEVSVQESSLTLLCNQNRTPFGGRVGMLESGWLLLSLIN